MNRRGILGLLGSAPIVGPAVVKEVASAAVETNRLGAAADFVEGERHVAELAVSEVKKSGLSMMQRIRQVCAGDELPPSVEQALIRAAASQIPHPLRPRPADF